MTRSFRRFVSAFAIAATLLWGFAGAATPAHDPAGAHGTSASAAVAGDAHGAKTVSVPCGEKSAAGQAGGVDRCCPPGCGFSAMTPMPSGIALHAPLVVPAMALDAVVPTGGAAPPLRPPRVS